MKLTPEKGTKYIQIVPKYSFKGSVFWDMQLCVRWKSANALNDHVTTSFRFEE
jgi:hypothetical protein